MKKIVLKCLAGCAIVVSFVVLLVGGNEIVKALEITYEASTACRFSQGGWHYCYGINGMTDDEWHDSTSLSGSIAWQGSTLGWSIEANETGFKINFPNIYGIGDIFEVTSFTDGNAKNCKTYGIKWVLSGYTSASNPTNVTNAGYFPRAVRCNEYNPTEFTLTAYAVTEYRSSDGAHKFLTTSGAETGWATSPPSDAWKTSKTVSSGSAATVDTSSFNPSGYTWSHWGSSCETSERDGRKCTKSSLTSNRVVYAYYVPKYTLTIDAGTGTSISVERKSSTYASTGTLADKSDIYKDDKLKICLTISNGYTFESFTIKSGSGSASNISPTGTYCTDTSSSQFTVSNNTTITARAKRDEFYGKSLVSSSNGTWTTSNGASVADNNTYTQTSGTRTYYIQNCDPVNGCTAKFWHYLKRTQGNGSTTYKVTRTSNYGSVSGGTVIETTTESFSSGNEIKEREEAFVNKLKPGQTVCETLTFRANVVDGDKSLTVCAMALGDAQPPDPDPDGPNGDQAFLNIKVKNDDVTAYNSYQREVYAKPGDNLTFRATYNPVLQYTFNLIPQKIKVNSGSAVRPQNGANTNQYMWSLYNNNKSQLGSGLKNWNNTFAVNASGFSFSQNYNANGGDTTFQEKTNSHGVTMAEVGGSGLAEIINLNTNDTNKTTPSNVKFAAENIGGTVYNVGNIITTTTPRTATAKVPYNYINTTDITTPESEILYAGESNTFKFNYVINPKTNSYTTNGSNDKYATMVRNPKWKLRARIGDDWVVETDVKTASSIGSDIKITEMSQSKTYPKEVSLNVPDVPAGTKICLKSMIYPASSGADNNMDANGDGKWAESEEKCFTVAKKPSLQVWGGGVYSAGKIETAVSEKNHVDGVNNYSASEKNDSYHVFGSWAELNVVSINTVKGFASGASTGYASNDNGILQPNQTPPNGSGNTGAVVGGSEETSLNYCLRSVLTIANALCKNGIAGSMGGSGMKTADKNKASLITRFVNNREEDRIDYEERENGESIGGVTVEMGHTKVIKIEGDMIIGSDINFLDSMTYERLADVPKLILYADNIKISCAVNRIDAVLIAEDDVDTCYESDDLNSEANSNQLKINGSVIADTLTAKRTYGASTGANSIVPAEIVNYDSTLYIWGANEADVTNTAKITTTYTRELSPRY